MILNDHCDTQESNVGSVNRVDVDQPVVIVAKSTYQSLIQKQNLCDKESNQQCASTTFLSQKVNTGALRSWISQFVKKLTFEGNLKEIKTFEGKLKEIKTFGKR